MAPAPHVPIIVGVGEIKNTSREPKDAAEPMRLMVDAIKKAGNDTGARNTAELLASIDCINAVHTWTWPYSDLPGLIASELKATPKHKHYSTVGGDKPVSLLDDAMRKIAHGHADIAVVAGGEALASLTSHVAKTGETPSWWTNEGEGATSHTTADHELPPGIHAEHNIGLPIQIYPLYENAFRHHRSQSLAANHNESSQLYGHFAEIAARNPSAWSYGKPPASAKDIAAVGKKNRMICFPYPLLMNAFNTVNMGAACILTSTSRAEALKIPKDRWIYPLGAAGTSQSGNFWERPRYTQSDCLNRSLDATLSCSGLRVSDLDHVDIYSCFPIVPKLAAAHLGLPINDPSRPLTVIGGLTSFGGAGNNYSLHAVAETVRLLRQGKGRHGLVLANGGVLTYHHAICLSSRPPPAGHVIGSQSPLPKLVTDILIPEIEMKPSGVATIETYTVDFDKQGRPTRGHIVGRLQDGQRRFVSNHGDDYTLNELCSMSKEPIGRHGLVSLGQEGNNLFKLSKPASL